MKKIIILAVLFCALVSCSTKNPHSASPLSLTEISKRVAEAGAVRDEHKILHRLVGTWDVQSKMWFDPNKAPEAGTGTATFTSVLGGRFVRQDYAGTSLGNSFEGIGYLGFDSLNKEYVASWIDTMTTQLTRSTGVYDAGADTLTFQGALECPVSGETVESLEVWTFGSDTHVTLTMYTGGEVKPEAKSLEVQYVRKG